MSPRSFFSFCVGVAVGLGALALVITSVPVDAPPVLVDARPSDVGPNPATLAAFGLESGGWEEVLVACRATIAECYLPAGANVPTWEDLADGLLRYQARTGKSASFTAGEWIPFEVSSSDRRKVLEAVTLKIGNFWGSEALREIVLRDIRWEELSKVYQVEPPSADPAATEDACRRRACRWAGIPLESSWAEVFEAFGCNPEHTFETAQYAANAQLGTVLFNPLETESLSWETTELLKELIGRRYAAWRDSRLMASEDA